MTDQQPYPQQPQQPFQPAAPYIPPKKKAKWPWIVGGIILFIILGIAGCSALFVGAANEVDKESKEVVEVTYRVEGSGSTASITFTDKGTNMGQETQASIPWEKKVSIDGLGKYASVTATADYDAAATDTISCKILVDGQVKFEQTAKGPLATASCSGSVD